MLRNTKEPKRKNLKSSTLSARQVVGIVMFAFSVIVFLCLVTGGRLFASAGREVFGFMVGVFGCFSYAVFLCLIVVGVMLFAGVSVSWRPRTVVFSLLLLVVIGLCLQVVTTRDHLLAGQTYGEYLSACYTDGVQQGLTSAGGVVLGLVAYPVFAVLGEVGSYILYALLIVLCVFGAVNFRAVFTYRQPVPEGRVKGYRDYDLSQTAGEREPDPQKPSLFVTDLSDPAPKSRRRQESGGRAYDILLGSAEPRPEAKVVSDNYDIDTTRFERAAPYNQVQPEAAPPRPEPRAEQERGGYSPAVPYNQASTADRGGYGQNDRPGRESGRLYGQDLSGPSFSERGNGSYGERDLFGRQGGFDRPGAQPPEDEHSRARNRLFGAEPPKSEGSRSYTESYAFPDRQSKLDYITSKPDTIEIPPEEPIRDRGRTDSPIVHVNPLKPEGEVADSFRASRKKRSSRVLGGQTNIYDTYANDSVEPSHFGEDRDRYRDYLPEIPDNPNPIITGSSVTPSAKEEPADKPKRRIVRDLWGGTIDIDELKERPILGTTQENMTSPPPAPKPDLPRKEEPASGPRPTRDMFGDIVRDPEESGKDRSRTGESSGADKSFRASSGSGPARDIFGGSSQPEPERPAARPVRDMFGGTSSSEPESPASKPARDIFGGTSPSEPESPAARPARDIFGGNSQPEPETPAPKPVRDMFGGVEPAQPAPAEKAAPASAETGPEKKAGETRRTGFGFEEEPKENKENKTGTLGRDENLPKGFYDGQSVSNYMPTNPPSDDPFGDQEDDFEPPMVSAELEPEPEEDPGEPHVVLPTLPPQPEAVLPGPAPDDVPVPEKPALRPDPKIFVSPYNPPSIDLLKDRFYDPNELLEDQDQKKEVLEQALSDFKVNAKVVTITPGPTVTRFELQMPPGVPVSRVTGLADDITMYLAAKGTVRIEAPIPGKSLLGIEVPNAKKALVGLRDVLDTEEFRQHKSPLAFALGKDIAGKNIIQDIAKMPHLLVAGSTGSGKSVCLNSIILSLMYKSSPEDVRIILIDPKRVEFNKYEGLPHLMLKNVITDPDKAIAAFGWAINEMNRRFDLFQALGSKDINSYNERINPETDQKLCRIVIIVDELAELMMGKRKDEIETRIQRLAQLARAAGIHLVLATQRPSVDVITGVIKANMPTRAAFRVMSNNDARTVELPGAEKLLGEGDMLFITGSMNKPMRLQGPFVTEREIETVVDYVRENNEAYYDDTIEQKINEEKQAAEESAEPAPAQTAAADDGENAKMLPRVLKMGIEAGQLSISMVQRRFGMGYARAGKMIDELDKLGYISPFEGSKPRQVYMSMAEFKEKFGDVD